MLSTSSSQATVMNPLSSASRSTPSFPGSSHRKNNKKPPKDNHHSTHSQPNNENAVNGRMEEVVIANTTRLRQPRPVFGNIALPSAASVAVRPPQPSPFVTPRSIACPTPQAILSHELNRSSRRHPEETENPSNDHMEDDDDESLLFSPALPKHPTTKTKQVLFVATTETKPTLPPPHRPAFVATPVVRDAVTNLVLSTTASAALRSTPQRTKSGVRRLDLSHRFLDATKEASERTHMAAMRSSSMMTKPRINEGQSTPWIQNQVVDHREEKEGTHNVTDNDEDSWAETQVPIFTKWLNYLFYPSSKEEPSTPSRAALRSLSQHQQMAQARRKAHALFHSAAFQKIRDVVAHEIGRQRIALRPDRDLYANLEDRGNILALLLSYSTPWLRLGLETMFHTTISMHGSFPKHFTPTKKQTGRRIEEFCLKNFILQHVLSDEQILSKYTMGGKCKVPSGPFEERYRAELRTVVVYRLLVLILFLDRAKMAPDGPLLTEVPNLFLPTASVKSTREVLWTFCRRFLKAEGDFTKHLARLGIRVHYQQEARDEIDFTVTNLRVDLNDGVRLTRMTELLTGNSQLISQLRLPAVSRLQKFHNVQLAMSHLVHAGVFIAPDVAAHHIVDGHREMVLKLLWSVVGHCCLPDLLSVAQVQREIVRIQKLHGLPVGPIEESELPLVLLRWCDTIGSRFGSAPVSDWSQSFADGRAVCLLIHYYHPTLLRWKDIRRTSRDPWAKYCPADRLLANERANGILANRCVSDLGGIPEVLPICDTNHPPEEKTMLFALTFLCSRLMESSLEIRACHIIQKAYRRYRQHIERVHQNAAAVILLQTWRRYRHQYFAYRQARYGAAVRVIEAFVTQHRSALRILQWRRLQNEQAHAAAVILQKHIRSWRARSQVSSVRVQKQSVVSLQCQWRQTLARRRVQQLVQRRDQASRLIQCAWRMFQRHDTRKSHAAMQIQRMYRGYWHRVQFLIDILDIIAVQSCVRRYLVQRDYRRWQSWWMQQQLTAALRIQCSCRRWLAQKNSQRIQQSRKQVIASVTLQSKFRQWNAQTLLLRMKYDVSQHSSATKIQSIWKMYQCRSAIAQQKVAQRNIMAAVALQCSFRRYQAQFYLSKLRHHAKVRTAAILVQAKWRAYRVQTRWIAVHFAATCIQTLIRRRIVSNQMRRAQSNAAIIQRAWRTFQARADVRYKFIAIRRIQATGRMLLSKLECRRRRSAILPLQCVIRMYLAVCQRRCLQQLQRSREAAAIFIQRRVRGLLTLIKFRLVKQDAVTIQKVFRRYQAMHWYQQKKLAIILLQSAVRRCLAQQSFHRLKANMIAREKRKANAVVSLQAMLRRFQVRKEMDRRRGCAILIQSVFRGSLRRNCYLESIWNIVRAQSVVRRWLAYRQASHRLVAVLRIQCATRRFFARCQRLSLLARKYSVALERFSALTIQRIFRGMKGRQLAIKESSARMIQKTWRCFTIHVEYMLSILAAMDIQAAIRRYLAMADYEYQYAAVVCIQSFSRMVIIKLQLRREEKCAVLIQSFARMSSCRSAFCFKQLEKRSADLIQSNFRRYMTRSSFLFWKREAVTLQRCMRGFLTRSHLKSEHIAATEIQRIWLGFVAREFLAWKVLAVIQLQSFFRRILARNVAYEIKREQLASKSIRLHSAIKIQKVYRGFVHHRKLVSAVKVIERVVRLFLSRRKFGKVQRGIVSTQSLVRGCIARCHRTKKLENHARRIAAATQKAMKNPSMKLGCRTQASLDVLRTSKSLSEIMAAVCVLEMSTRLSQTCCETFVQAGAPDILFSLIQTCNRSLPHIALLQYILLTMTNVARFGSLLPSLATATGVEIFLDLVQMFRDKELVFCLVASLLERVVGSNEEVLIQFISRENLKRLKGVRDLCVRKLSVVDPAVLRPSQQNRRLSFEGRGMAVPKKGPKKLDLASPDVRQGVRSLQRIIRWMERDGNGTEEKW